MKTGTCPVCNGTKRVPAVGKWANVCRGYDPADNTLPCHNCGGQTMSGQATGEVPLRPDGTPCSHHYVGGQRGNCYYVYACKYCGDRFDIDSSD